MRELFISKSCARFTPDEQDISAGTPHFYSSIQPNLSIRICSCRKVPAGITHVQAAATNNIFCGLEGLDKSLWRQRWHLLLLSLCLLCPILPGTHFFLELIKTCGEKGKSGSEYHYRLLAGVVKHYKLELLLFINWLFFPPFLKYKNFCW